MPEELRTFYCTFGCGFPLADYVQVVKAPDETTARLGMFRYYDNRWCGIYRRAEYVSDGKCAIGNIVYKVLEKVITAYDDDSIGCN